MEPLKWNFCARHRQRQGFWHECSEAGRAPTVPGPTPKANHPHIPLRSYRP